MLYATPNPFLLNKILFKSNLNQGYLPTKTHLHGYVTQIILLQIY